MNRIKMLWKAACFILKKRPYKATFMILNRDDMYDTHVIKVYDLMEKAKTDVMLHHTKYGIKAALATQKVSKCCEPPRDKSANPFKNKKKRKKK